MMFNKALLLLAAMVTNVAAEGSDYIDAAPETVYEAEMMSPQNMDFNKEKNMFAAHAGWYNDKLIHYYKFRMYTPMTYPDLIKPGQTDVPLQKVYMTTKDGTLTGAMGMPIIEYHTADGLVYSDFMEVQLVTVPADYTENTYKSVGDITESGNTVTPSGVVLNLPVVPTGSTMEDPANKGEAAPIDPVMVWYKGVKVTTYVFEVTDQEAADYFASTRTEPEGATAQQRSSFSKADYAIPVTPFATATRVNAIPLWHVNQFSRGVVEGENSGGPSPMGMRNIINLDRGDAGYSPLWAINWLTELPINYEADQASNNVIMTEANGFKQVATPMVVNCPDIGAVGAVNEKLLSSFQMKIETDDEKSYIMGSHMSLIMQKDVPVSMETEDGTVIATTKTNMMGAYEFALPSADIPEGTMKVMIMAKDEMIREIAVKDMMSNLRGSASPVTTLSWLASAAMVAIAAVAM